MTENVRERLIKVFPLAVYRYVLYFRDVSFVLLCCRKYFFVLLTSIFQLVWCMPWSIIASYCAIYHVAYLPVISLTQQAYHGGVDMWFSIPCFVMFFFYTTEHASTIESSPIVTIWPYIFTICLRACFSNVLVAMRLHVIWNALCGSFWNAINF